MNNNNSIQIFSNESFGEVRVAGTSEQPMFCLADICKILELTNASMVKSRLNEKGISNIDTLTNGGVQQMIFVNEGNLYKCIFQSRKHDAEKFQDWICDGVIPSIRKTGKYEVEQISYPEALRRLADEIEAKEKAQLQLEQKAEQLDESKQWYSIKRYAKENNLNWRSINWRAMKALSAEHGYKVKKIFDGNYGEVNIYHIDVFNIYFNKPGIRMKNWEYIKPGVIRYTVE